MSRWNKNRINYLHFSYGGFYDYNNFVVELLQVLQENTQYSLLLRLKYNKVLYGMVGLQIGFLYEKDNLDSFDKLHNVLKRRLNKFCEDYKVEEINAVQLLYVRIEDMPEFKIENLNKVNFKLFSKERDNKTRFTSIPLTMDDKYFGKLLLKDRKLYINRINKQRAILNEGALPVSDISSIHLYEKYLIVTTERNNIFYRDIYDADTGILDIRIEDKVIKDNLFIRNIGNNSLTILDNKIVKIESDRKLSAITYKSKSLKDESNTLIGSWDIEAFRDVDGYAKVYALGFFVLGGTPKTYYLEDGISSDELVLKCLDDMLTNQFKGYTFYTHNFGRYDSIFLIKILKEFNIRKGYEYYKLSTICRDNKILKLTISVKRSLSDRKQSKTTVRKDPGYNTITIVDSLNLLNQSLDKLCESFGVEVVKGKFPHNFVNRDTLNYVGNTPDFSYWSRMKLSDYKELQSSNWSLKDECIKYLEKDLISLTLIFNKFSEYINRKYHLQVTDCLTVSRLALNIFLKEYLKDSKLPIIGKNMFSDIKQAYYGGVTEVYKPFGKNLYYYDVNSLYPFAALNSMPGINCTFVENIGNSIDLKDLFGFFYCEVKAKNNYLGLLPVHVNEGLIMPNGTWKGWYFSEELQFASSQGYEITIIKGYNFNRVDNVFTDYVNDLYKLKSTTKDSVEKDINKRLLNHLLGRFGMNIVKPVTELVDNDKLSFIMSTREVIGQPKSITENDHWITYHSEINEDICKEHGIDYFKVLNHNVNSDNEKLNEFKDVSLTTAAVVTAYARIYMSKIKLDILNKGGNVYYTDTDSIVTDITLDDKLVGNGLGQFKLEHKVKEGYFISNKTYCLQLFEKFYDKYLDEWRDYIIKSKSVDRESLKVNDFINLYKGISLEATKRSAISNYSKGSVLIVDDKIQVNHDSYTKREKIFKRSKWVDTKPLILKNSILEIKPSKKSKSTKLTNFTSSENTSNKDKSDSKKNKWEYFIILFENLNNIYTYFNKINIYRIKLLIYIKRIINFFIWLLILLLLLLMYTTNNEVINEELESLLESKYNDDYMEEPVEIEISENTSCLDVFTIYKDMFVNYYTNFVSLFSQHTSYGLNTNYIPNFVSEVLTDKIKHNLLENTSEYSTNERPSVLVDFLLYHLNVSEQKLMRLNDTITAAEVSRIRTSHAIQDTLILCKDALKGKPYESPVGYRNSPIPVRNSLLFERGILLNSTPETVQTQFSDYQGSFVDNQPLINEINALMKSPYLDTSSPIIDTYSPNVNSNSPSINTNSPSINTNSPSIDTNRSYIRSRSSTPIYKVLIS